MPKARKKHKVQADFQVPELSIAGSSLTLRLYANRQKIGELHIGRGSLFWYGRYHKVRKRINWTRFGDMMNELAYGKK